MIKPNRDQRLFYRYACILLAFSLAGLLKMDAALAQSITPASDGTGTLVTRDGQTFDIEAGSLSADGSNLFHSFQTFQPNSGEIVNFLADPAIQNIFARINGGNPSVIDGLLQISDSQANLFLLNPAGVIFGPNATLNLPAALTVTTANRIGFEDGWFKTAGRNNYAALVGRPTEFEFTSSQPGIIVNEADLGLGTAQALTLLGGRVLNTGRLTSSDRAITIAEVPGEQIVRITQTGSLLNLELSRVTLQNLDSSDTSLTAPNFMPQTLPALLTNGRLDHASQMVINPGGTVSLTDSSLTISNQLEIVNRGRSEIADNSPKDTRVDLPSSGSALQSGRAGDRNQGDVSVSSNHLEGNHPEGNQAEHSRAEHSQNNEAQSGGLKRPHRGRGRGHHAHRAVLDSANASAALDEVEEQRTQEFSAYFGRDLRAAELTPPQIRQLLTQVETQTSNRSVVVYVKAPKLEANTSGQLSSPLELLVFTTSGEPVSLVIPDVSRDELFQTIAQFRSTLITSARRGSKSYLTPAQQLYQWLVKPLEDEMGPDAIDTVLFSMDSGLRSLPMAALHDGQQFLIEKYSVGMVPSLGLMNTQYQPLDDVQVLAMGASAFQALQPLPAVPTELNTINQLWPSQRFLNETFTRYTLIQQQKQAPSQIIHLATHAEFKAGNVDNSYIQLWDESLRLSDIHTLGWDNPAVDLLVLSACHTAVGSPEAEMGFAGLAVASGVKSAVASLWAVSDVGTLALMHEFYQQLRTSRVKSEALRSAQLALLKGEARIESGQLISEEFDKAVSLPPELKFLGNMDFSHPYYWSGFTMIGSPW
ncbi:MAG: CHAT domain-containing protein [Cyanobacteria bacterium P01_D01_bin.44]